MKNPDQLRHILKTISWRIVGTIDTMIVSYIITGSIKVGMAIGGFEVFTKMILYYLHERVWFKYVSLGRINQATSHSQLATSHSQLATSHSQLATSHSPLATSSQQPTASRQPPTANSQQPTPNIIPQSYTITHTNRITRNNHPPKVFWMTGLSGSGKSTIANALQNELFQKGYQVYVLDGDNIRGGLNKDLDFSDTGRMENIRRISEVAKLFADAGFVVITAFISPFKTDRQQAKDIIGTETFCEVYVNAPLEVCEQRDVKGLYKKARAGEIKNFTGIGSAFEEPENPAIVIKTNELSINESVELLITQVTNNQ
jgi:adenylylsulfate kinase